MDEQLAAACRARPATLPAWPMTPASCTTPARP